MNKIFYRENLGSKCMTVFETEAGYRLEYSHPNNNPEHRAKIGDIFITNDTVFIIVATTGSCEECAFDSASLNLCRSNQCLSGCGYSVVEPHRYSDDVKRFLAWINRDLPFGYNME